MKLLDELRICIMVLDTMKQDYLEKSLEKIETGVAVDLMTGQYIAYASCQSLLIDLVKKYENREEDP